MRLSTILTICFLLAFFSGCAGIKDQVKSRISEKGLSIYKTEKTDICLTEKKTGIMAGVNIEF